MGGPVLSGAKFEDLNIREPFVPFIVPFYR